MHVARITALRTNKAGEERLYESVLLRRSVRNGSKVGRETLSNLSALPPDAVEVLAAALSGKTLLTAGDDLQITRSLPHGHVAAVTAQATQLHFPALLGLAC